MNGQRKRHESGCEKSDLERHLSSEREAAGADVRVEISGQQHEREGGIALRRILRQVALGTEFVQQSPVF